MFEKTLVMRKYILLLLSLFIVVVSCEKDDKPTIAINETEINVSNVRNTEVVSFSTNRNWTANSSESWCTISQNSGVASTTSITLVSEANNTFNVRSSLITISIEGLSKSFKIYQTQGTQVATPIINPSGGRYTTSKTITIASFTEGAEIRYTLDGSNPTNRSKLYMGEFVINESVTIKAKAFKTDWIASSMASEVFIVSLGAEVIVGSLNAIQHIDASKDFVLQLNNLDNKEVYFVFSNQNEKRQVNLPQLQSNIVAKNKVEKSTAFAKPTTFLVSGKPSISKFNNSAHQYLEKGATKPQYLQQRISTSANLSVGTSDELYDDLGIKIKSTIRKKISAHGKNLYVWVADNCWEQNSIKKYNVTQQMVDDFAPKFLNPGNDNDIYEWVTNAVGEPWGSTAYSNLIPETDDIHIWLMDIDNDNKTTGTVTLGYYYSRDNYSKSTLPDSNQKLMFTIDAVLFAETDNGLWSLSNFWPQQMISTLAHEFTHMIYFYQHVIKTNQDGDVAINEMSAQCVEDLVANKISADGPRGVPYATPSAGYIRNYDGRLPLYNSHNDYNLLDWSSDDKQSLINYSKTYALGAYLMRNYGGANFIKALIQSRYNGIESIVEAVNYNGGAGLSFGDILQQFGVANLLSNQTITSKGYMFNTKDWSRSIVNGVTYDLGAINLYNYSPAPFIYDKLPNTQMPNSNVYYRAGSNLNGDIEWYFNGIDKNTKVTVVIK